MNLKPGGEGGFNNEQHKVNFLKAGAINLINSKEKRLFEIAKMVKDPIKSKIWKQKIKKGLEIYYKENEGTFKNRKHSKESRIKISKSIKGKGLKESNSQYGTMWITNGIENKKIKKTEIIPFGYYKGRIKINMVAML